MIDILKEKKVKLKSRHLLRQAFVKTIREVLLSDCSKMGKEKYQKPAKSEKPK